jgi:hypothetical protein
MKYVHPGTRVIRYPLFHEINVFPFRIYFRYSGVGSAHRRKMIDDQEEQVTNSTARLERSRVKYERLNKIMVSMK